MSKYTTEVRFICEEKAGLIESEGFHRVDEIITIAAPKIFDFEYPVFDNNYKLPLEVKILRHYYTREIAFETVGLWQLKLQAKLCEIMPYYNKLYSSELYSFNPFFDVDLTKDRKGDRETNTTGSGSGSGTNSETVQNATSNNQWNTFQDTPQGALTNVQNESYLTDARHITDNGTDNTTRSGTNSMQSTSTEKIVDTDSYIEHIVGSNGGMSYSKKLEEYRKTLLNIDQMVLRDLKDLFFLLW